MIRKVSLIISFFILACSTAPGQTQSREERIREHTERIRRVIEEQRASGSASSETTGTVSGEISRQPELHNDDFTKQIQKANWQKLKDFYYIQDLKEVPFKGIQQEYKDDALHMIWWFEPKPEKLHYKWLETAGPEESISLTSNSTILLRSGGECAMLLIEESNRVDITRWHQPNLIYTAADLSVQVSQNPIRFEATVDPLILVTKNNPQAVNGWEFKVDDEGETLHATRIGTSETLRIGNKRGDFRPVDNMFIAISRNDPQTGSFLFNIDVGGFNKTLYACTSTEEFLENSGFIGGNPSVEQALQKLGQAYNFSVEFANDNTRSLAAAEDLDKPHTISENSTLLAELEKSLQPEFVPEIVSAEVLRVHASPRFKADKLELPKLQELTENTYRFQTRVYTLNRLSADTAETLIQEKLGSYLIVPNDSIGRHGDVLQAGDYYSIIKWPLQGQTPKPPIALPRKGIPEPERVIADEKSGTLVVTAAPGTHEEITKLLEEIDAAGKQSTFGETQTAPARQRLQLVLLQGGEAGTTAELTVPESSATSITYDASVPQRYGMTHEDLKVLGFSGAAELGRTLVNIVSDPGEPGQSTITLGNKYPVHISYRDERQPYLVIEGSLSNQEGETLARNTIMLEQGKPAFLGVTNLSGAVILVITWLGDSAQAGKT